MQQVLFFGLPLPATASSGVATSSFASFASTSL